MPLAMPRSTFPSLLRVAVAGLTANGLYWTERLALIPEVRVAALYDPQPHVAPGSLVEPTTDWEDFRRHGPFDLLLLDPAIPQRDQVLSFAFEHHLPCLLVSLDCTAADLTRWDREAVAAGTPLGFLDLPAPLDTTRLSDLVHSGMFGPLRVARRVQHSLRSAPASLATPRRHWAHEVIRSSFETLRQWGARNASVTAILGHNPDQQTLLAAVSITGTGALWPSESVPAMFLFDLDNAARVAQLPGWVLEAATASYADGVLYTTTEEGEIVDVPQPTPDVTATAFTHADPLLAALDGLCTDHRFPVTLSEAALPLAWTEQLLARLGEAGKKSVG
jgi:hypothetical protein